MKEVIIETDINGTKDSSTTNIINWTSLFNSAITGAKSIFTARDVSKETIAQRDLRAKNVRTFAIVGGGFLAIVITAILYFKKN